MLTRLRTHFGTAGLIVAVVALIAALGGAAIAAGGGSGGSKATASAKGKPGPRGPRGKTGPAGPAGPAGSAGAAGPVGPAGPQGSPGANGQDGAAGAAGPTGPKGAAGVGSVGETGPTGPTGPTGTFGGIFLPEGVTETGFWAFNTPGTKAIKDGDGNMVTVGSSEAWAPISFPDIVEEPGGAINIILQSDPTFEQKCEVEAGGEPANPKAPIGSMCVWSLNLSNATLVHVCKSAPVNCAIDGIRPTGGYLRFTTAAEGPAFGFGTWALTGGPPLS
jgi:hypothetical protein